MTALRIGEAAQRTGVSAANIRYYEKEGLLAPAARQDNQYRAYAEADLHRLRFIRLCRSMDMSLDEVRSLLALDWNDPSDCVAARDAVQSHLDHVRQRLQELQALEKELLGLRDCCDGQKSRCALLAALHAHADAAAPTPGLPLAKRHV